MHGKGTSRLAVLLLAAAALSPATVGAGTPWEKLLSTHRVEAEPNNPYPLAEEHGPWLIMACSFSGDGAEGQATALVHELRKKYKLPAFSYRMRFDLNETFGRGCDRFGEPVKMKYQRGTEINEIAVLVGHFKAVDDPEAQETLKQLKYLQPDCLQVGEGKKTNASLAAWRMIQKQVLAPSSAKKKKGPMGHAFVVANPLLPQEYFVPKGLDGFVVRLNQGVEHSLLGCPGKFTVQVAHFTGKVVTDQSEIQAIQRGKEMESRLAEAADKAHRLTEALRRKGYEAYEFHDRQASIVTVGSFDSVGSPRADGKIEINPKIHAVMKTFAAEQAQLPGQPAGAMKPKVIDGVVLDIQPIPVEVPKRSASSELTSMLPRP